MRIAFKTNIAKFLLASSLVVTSALTYQNCSPVNFSVSEQRSTAPNAPSGQIEAPPLKCEFNGDTLNEGQTIIAYQNSSVPFGQVCLAEIRKCEGGELSGSFSYANCEVEGPQSCLFNGRTIPHNGTVDAYQNSTVAFGGTCEREARVCNNGVLSGSFQYTTCAPDAPAMCLFNGRNVAHGTKVSAYRNSSVPFGGTCEREDRVCNNGSLSGSYTYATCSPGQPKTCMFNGRSIAHGETVMAFQDSSVSYGQKCVSESRKCDNGVLSGNYTFGSCEVGAPRSCLFNGQTVAHGQQILAYEASSVAFGRVCVSQKRKCDNGALSGTYTFGTCNVALPASCLFDGRTIAHGEHVTGFYNSRVPYGSTCRSADRTCQNGTLSGNTSAVYGSCVVDGPAACLFNGQTIPHGQKVVAYGAAKVPFGQSCASQERVCNNGALSGSYAAPSCVVDNPRTCTFNGQAIPHGGQITAYASSTVPFGGTCASQTRTCDNGVLSGIYTQPTCSVTPPASCSFNGQAVAHGQPVVAYASPSVPYGEACSSQQRVCSNGTLGGNYAYASCSVAPAASCSFNGQTIGHGQPVTAYASPSVPYGQACASQQRVCLNGSLTGTYGYTSCAATPPAACSFNGQTIPHGQAVTAFHAPSVPFGQNCAAEARTCDNGRLTGSAGYSGCAPEAGRSCTFTYMEQYQYDYGYDSGTFTDFREKTITMSHGQTITLFSSFSVSSRFGGYVNRSCPVESYAQVRTCWNGSVTGNAAYVYDKCTVYEFTGGGSPLMVHFDSNVDHFEPLEFSSQLDGILFDILGRNSKPAAHSPLRISWYKSPQYHFLTLPNAKGEVRGVDELFGNNTFGPDQKFAADGYKALAKYDGMSADGKTSVGTPDGYITKQDPVFAKLRFWNDRNYDGVAQATELRSMDELGVEVIDLNADPNFKETDQYGNETTLKSVVKTKDGRYHLMFDIWFDLSGGHK